MANTRSSVSRVRQATSRNTRSSASKAQQATSRPKQSKQTTGSATVDKQGKISQFYVGSDDGQKASVATRNVWYENIVKEFLMEQVILDPRNSRMTGRVKAGYLLQIALPKAMEQIDEFAEAIAAFERRSSLRSRMIG